MGKLNKLGYYDKIFHKWLRRHFQLLHDWLTLQYWKIRAIHRHDWVYSREVVSTYSRTNRRCKICGREETSYWGTYLETIHGLHGD